MEELRLLLEKIISYTYNEELERICASELIYIRSVCEKALFEITETGRTAQSFFGVVHTGVDIGGYPNSSELVNAILALYVYSMKGKKRGRPCKHEQSAKEQNVIRN